MADASRYVGYSQKSLSRQRKTISLHGADDDSGKYFRCWNCGFICNKDKHPTGGGRYGTSGVDIKDFCEISKGDIDRNDVDILDTVIVLDDHFTILRNGLDGNPVTNYRHNQYPDISGGCPFCGCKTYR